VTRLYASFYIGAAADLTGLCRNQLITLHLLPTDTPQCSKGVREGVRGLTFWDQNILQGQYKFKNKSLGKSPASLHKNGRTHSFPEQVPVTEGAAHSIRKARTGSIEAACCAGMMPAMAAANTSTPMATIMTGIFTVVMS